MDAMADVQHAVATKTPNTTNTITTAIRIFTSGLMPVLAGTKPGAGAE